VYPRVRVLAVSALSGLLIVGIRGASADTHSKIDRAVRDSVRAGAVTQHVIITVAPGFRASTRRALEAHGDFIRSEHPLIDALSADIHAGDVEELASRPWVKAISADAVVHAKGVPPGRDKHHVSAPWKAAEAPLTTAPPATLRETLGLPRIADDSVPTGATGVTVAIIDSGIEPGPDFGGRITGFWDFTNGGAATAPYDDYGHGTHIAGLIGSGGAGSNGEFQGIAPDVHLIGLKVLDSTGAGKTSDVISALQFLIANKNRLHVQVVNLSLGHPILAPAADDPLVQAVEQATAAGLIVVTASGNFGENDATGQPGYTGVTSPGDAPSAITVGAARTENTVGRGDDTVAAFSSRGPTWYDAFAKPDVIAPGYRLASNASVTSYLYTRLAGSRAVSHNGQPLLVLSGTSMSAAVTTGVVALMLQAHNQSGFHRQAPLTANLAKALLEYSAIPVAGADVLSQGAGEINAAGAVALAGAIDTNAGPGSWWLRSGVTPSSSVGGQSYAWGRHVIWGGSVLTGDLIYVNNAVWGANIVWGTSFTNDNIVWGTSATVVASNIVWDDNIVWGTNLVWSNRLIGQRTGAGIVWASFDGSDNIVWGTLADDNIVWGTVFDDNIVWGTFIDDNIVWGTTSGDNIVWGTSFSDDNIVWGTDDNIVWGTDDNIVWGTGDNIVWGTSGVF
jgi:serine protease AprX